MTPSGPRSIRRSLGAHAVVLAWALGCATACDESTEVLGTKRDLDASRAPEPKPNPDAANESAPRSRDASTASNLDASAMARPDAPMTRRDSSMQRDASVRRDASARRDSRSGFDSAPPLQTSETQPPETPTSETQTSETTESFEPDGGPPRVRDAAPGRSPDEAGSMTSAAPTHQTAPLAPVPNYFQYPEGCEVADELPDPGWCSLSIECADRVLATDCQSDDLSWDCATDFYSGDHWSPGFPDEYRLLRVPGELAPADACSLATVLAANHFEPSNAEAECSVQTGTDPSGTCTRAPGCWYAVPASPFEVWQDTAPGVYCGYLSAELWDDVEDDAWHCFFDGPGSKLDVYVLDDGTQTDACEYGLDLFSSFSASAPPTCAPESVSLQDDECSAQLDCSVLGSGNGHDVELHLVPRFDCIVEGQDAVCTCGSGTVSQSTASSTSTAGWCRDLAAACESGLEDGSIPF